MDVFIKQNQSSYKDQLICEARGLEELRKRATTLKIPRVLEVTEDRLALERVESQPFSESAWTKLGAGLAELHQETSEAFGLDCHNYIGLNPQYNAVCHNWGEFFVKYRLNKQVEMIKDSALRQRCHRILREKSSRLSGYLNAHSPAASPVHGDLWSGNVLWDGNDVWLIDPAFYFGDREVDIAMTKMFGGFGPAFYLAYNGRLNLPQGNQERSNIYNLYHCLNHYNLFGKAYLSAVEAGFASI